MSSPAMLHSSVLVEMFRYIQYLYVFIVSASEHVLKVALPGLTLSLVRT